MAEVILFVFEGDRTEKTISDTMMKHFMDKETRVIISSFKTDIYTLYKEVKADDDMDIVYLLQKRNENLKQYRRSSFSQVYLFFDYDGHSHVACDNKISELLSFFDEETDNGKLFISYPMVESLKCISSSYEIEEFCDHSVPIDSLSGFKKYASEYACRSLIHFNLYSIDTWNKVIRMHCTKANNIVRNVMSFPINQITQIEIFENQKEKFINKSREVSILSSFPLMLMHFFGYQKLYEDVSGKKIDESNALS